MNTASSQQIKPSVGILYLVPVPLAPGTIHFLPSAVIEKAPQLKYYFVEQLRTARRFLKEMNRETDMDSIQFSEMNQHRPPNTALLRQWLEKGFEVGVMSEAGCPGVADPGSVLVALAHEMGARVVPFPGPNSMLMALMASGFNGQCYRFVGYLPVKQPDRNKAIKEMERSSAQRGETQIFMETPYRNNQLFQELLSQCKDQTLLGVAAGITSASEFIRTRSIRAWRDAPPDLHKRPVVFTLMSK
ncbi:MAG TPA: SAM-dependent methyltransferase [Edaphocola sp.]|nr:SAM-dependent methyltransferase [Edaphocola sp.]